MIKIIPRNFDEIKCWYTDSLSGYIRSRKINMPNKTPEVVSNFATENLDNMSVRQIDDILLQPYEKLMNMYGWIREYVQMCNLLVEYPNFKSDLKGAPRKECVKRRSEWLRMHKSVLFFDDIIHGLKMTDECLTKSWKNLDKLRKSLTEYLKLLNDLIKQKFDYDFLDRCKIRHMLIKKLNIRVCPYCNNQYIYSIDDKSGDWYLGDIDHYLPKKIYQLFSLSIWNLIPVCKSCNQIFKRGKMMRVLNPYEKGFDNDCLLTVKYNSVKEIIGLEPIRSVKWEIQQGADRSVGKCIRNSCDMFHLDTSYEQHKKSIQSVLKNKYIYESYGYQKCLQKLIGYPDYSDIYGVSLDPDKFQEELRSKMIFDIVFHN